MERTKASASGSETESNLTFCFRSARLPSLLTLGKSGSSLKKQNRLKRCGVGKVLRKKIAKHHVPIRLAEQLHDVFRVLRTVNNRKIVCYAE